MLIALPPSEGKTRPASGPPVDLETLSLPQLNRIRQQLMNALVKVCNGSERRAMEILDLGPTQGDVIGINAELPDEPTARADEIYTGVLFSELSLCTLSDPARDRADATVVIASALFGLVRPSDAIPAYRLSAGGSLPRLGTLASRWRPHVPGALAELAGDGLFIDLRSGGYVALGKPTGSLAERTATVRVLHETDGKRSVVSHFNKATKGRIVRALIEADVNPATTDELHEVLTGLGWTVETTGNRLDVIVTSV